MCLAQTCHLHFSQDDRGLFRVTAATRRWNAKADPGEELNSPAAPAGSRRTGDLSCTTCRDVFERDRLIEMGGGRREADLPVVP